MRIIPAILEKDFSSIEKKLDFLSFLKNKYRLDFNTVQIDFCDGEFVENLTWLPTIENKEEIQKIISSREVFDIEYHLMCKDQYKYFFECKNLKAKRIVIHIDEIFIKGDREELEDIIKEAKENLIKILITSNLSFMDQNREEILSFLNKHTSIDLQIMSVDKIGVQGSDFDEKCISLIRFFRKNFKENDLYIQIDGSMNENTISLTKSAGANGVVVGSYLMSGIDEIKFISKFRNISNI